MSFLHTPILRVFNIVKRFPGVTALNGVSLELYQGEVHVLLGENGSGKSTLAKVISGIYLPDSGSIEVAGRQVVFSSPADAIRYGIYYIPQTPSLVESLTVTENVLLALRSYSLLAGVGRVREVVREVASKLGTRVDPDTKVSELSYTQRQTVELAKAVLLGARILIVDEVTTYLPRVVREFFYNYVRQVREGGGSVILITHKISEAVEVADRITILRVGTVVRTLERGEFNVELIRKLMFGNRVTSSTVEQPGGPTPGGGGEEVARLENAWARDDSGNLALRGVTLSIMRGEVLGVVGIAGNGQRELAEVLVGLRGLVRGRYYLRGADVTNRGTGTVRAAGVGFIPEAPLYYIFSGDLSLVENVAIASRWGPVIRWDSLASRVRKLVDTYGISAASPRAPVKTLSGGNIMRLAVARELELSRNMLVAYNATRSLDEAFSEYFLNAVRDLAQRGTAVVYISESVDEVLAVSNRVAVISSGRIVGLFDREGVNRDTVERLMVM
ncbi:MAG: ATP-binding cassette domain-containing protein [Desulfurococcaceae archaeon]|jgi:simple sugar transport system ATP-binding protein|nr:ATP-binding cassette domain-containing protein [Desulfurococcaceae archaeon]